jgi:Fe-S cluster biogenesis protein NfuA
MDVWHVHGLGDLRLDRKDGAGLDAAIDRVDDDEAVEAGHQLLEQRNAADAGLDELDAVGKRLQTFGNRESEAVVGAQRVADAGHEDALHRCLPEAYIWRVAAFDDVLVRLEELLMRMETLEEPLRSELLELLDGVDAIHRLAVRRLADELDDETIARLETTHPSIAWLFEAYGITAQDELEIADEALDEVRPYIHSHGGSVDVLAVEDGVVRVRLTGSCSGCSASTITLTHGIEEALREGFPGFRAVELEEDADAVPHPPPGPTLLQIDNRLA